MLSANYVLVVDDQPNNLNTLQALLAPLGLNLAFAADGPQALHQAAALQPDLILLDVMMPGMDGFEVCRRLRADPVLAEVPIIMVTALDDRESLLRGIEAGADDFVTKPFDRVVLRARVQTILRLNRYRRLVTERMRFAWVMEQAEDGYLMAVGNGAGDITYANSQARRWLGLKQGGDAPLVGTFRERVESRYRCVPETAWQQGELPHHLIRPETADESAFWLEVSVFHLPNTDASVIRLRDVTRQMELQREAWSFNTLVTHKLRTPVAGIVGALELLTELAGKLSPNEISNLAELAYRDAERLHGAVEDVLRYVHTSRLSHQHAPLSLSALEGVVAEIARVVELADVQVKVAPGLETLSVWPAHHLLKLILLELLENAKKFHSQNRPSVLVEVLRPQAADESRLLLRVVDDGRSLTEENLTRIWLPYYQVEKSMTGEVAGMGLGLSMVANLVWSVGGECRAENRADGPGLIIELLLPVAEPEPTLSYGTGFDKLELFSPSDL
ncbi:MAG: response regulator [Anaerolineales bacterium]|nr:response regulator [Anaerolineales bacterium]